MRGPHRRALGSVPNRSPTPGRRLRRQGPDGAVLGDVDGASVASSNDLGGEPETFLAVHERGLDGQVHGQDGLRVELGGVVDRMYRAALGDEVSDGIQCGLHVLDVFVVLSADGPDL